MRIVMIDMLPSLFDFLSAGVYPDNGISNPTVRRRRREKPRQNSWFFIPPDAGCDPYGAV